jgi:Protein of unknown function (DUF998)
MTGGVAKLAAAAAGVCVLGGGVAVATAAAAGPGRAVTSYLSEAGAGPHATPYRLGVLALALGLLLLALALPPALRLAAGFLGAAAVCAVLSGTVTCSAGCPLPPYEPTTPRDLVHGTASIAAVAACVFAMLAVGLAGGPVPFARSVPLAARVGPLAARVGPLAARVGSLAARVVPPAAGGVPAPAGGVPAPAGVPASAGGLSLAAGGVSLAAAAVALPLSAVVGIGMLTVGRGPLVGITERLLLAVVAGWLCYLAASRVFAGPGVEAEAPSRS